MSDLFSVYICSHKSGMAAHEHDTIDFVVYPTVAQFGSPLG